MARVIADEVDRQVVSKGDLRLAEERLMRQITEAKYDLLKWGVAAVAVILAAICVFVMVTPDRIDGKDAVSRAL